MPRNAPARVEQTRAGGSSATSPSLVVPAVAGPEDQLRAVGSRGAVGVQAQARLHAGDRAVGVEIPLLIGLPVAVPDDRRGAVGGALAIGVEALVAIHLQL